MGKYIKHGILPLILLRLFKIKNAVCENRYMDEHIQLSEGIIGELECPFYDDNLNGLTWWTNKHNGYATREAIDLLLTEYNLNEESIVNSGEHSATIRRKKLKYIKMPLFWRAFGFLYFATSFEAVFLMVRRDFCGIFYKAFGIVL